MAENKTQFFKVVDKLNKAQKSQASFQVLPGEEIILVYALKKDMPVKPLPEISGKQIDCISYEELFEIRKKLFAELRAKKESEKKANFEQIKISRLHELNFIKDAIGEVVEKLSTLTDTTAESIFKKHGIDSSNFN